MLKASWILSILLFIFSQNGYAANGPICKLVMKPTKQESVDIVEAIQCQDLKVGESKNISLEKPESKTGFSADYSITKTAEKNYKIEFSLNIYDSLITFFKDNSTTDGIEQRIKQCLKKVNPYLWGPNGEHVELSVATELSEKGLFKEVFMTRKIEIVEEKKRATSADYNQDIDCATITHELLHLTGLIDEYEEFDLKDSGKSQSWRKYDCRIHYTGDSIMKKHYDAFFVLGLDANANPIRAGQTFINFRKNKMTLLKPAHFRAIIYPGCEKKNHVYYTCAKRAYLTSEFGKKCPDIPPECKSKDWLD